MKATDKRKKMRQELTDAGHTPPRSNDKLKIMHKLIFDELKLDEVASNELEKNEAVKKEPVKVLSVVPKDNEYTYIGQGDTPPQMINFMGQQIFLRGEKTRVTDPELIEKIKNNPSFVKGDFSREDLMESDRKWAKHAQDTRNEHVKMEIEMQRKNRKHG